MDKRNLKRILILAAIAATIGLVYNIAKLFSPGLYPYAERYVLPYSEENIKTIIKKIKRDNPEMQVPKVTIEGLGAWDLPDKPIKGPGSLSAFYFYYNHENQIIFTWTQSTSKNRTTLGLVSINNGLDIGHWRELNHDLSNSESETQKDLFEERILNKIRRELSNLK